MADPARDHAGIGFFGKLPAVGDFVQRRLPPHFVDVWDACLQAGMHQGRTRFDEDWPTVWRSVPVWRFALAPDVCGHDGWLGVLGPSLDRVGREFPLVLAAPEADVEALVDVAGRGGGWFFALEQVLRNVREGAGALEAFDDRVMALPRPGAWREALDAMPPARIDWSQADVWQPSWRPRGRDPALEAWVRACMEAGDGCLWWSCGGSRMSPRALLTRGLPDPETCMILFDAGDDGHVSTCTRESQRTVSASVDAEPDALLADLLPADATASADTTRHLEPPSHPEPASSVSAHCDVAGVVHGRDGPTTLLAADQGEPDPAREATAGIAAALDEGWGRHDIDSLERRLLGLHAPLRERREDLVNPIAEDAAVVAVRVTDGHAELLRIGAAHAWHGRKGRLEPLFVRNMQARESTASSRDGGTAWASDPATVPGLGAASQPDCEQQSCAVIPGDRLVLLATDTLAGIGEPVLVAALAEPTTDLACACLARATGFGADRSRWPWAVIEVGT